MLLKPFQNWPVAFHAFAAVLLCFVAVSGASQWRTRAERSIEQLHAAQTALEQLNTAEGRLKTVADPAQALRPEQWPLRQSIDTVIQQASQEALRLGLVVQSLSVSHQAASPAGWGRVNLDVSTAGSYAGSKAWQAFLMQNFSTLAVQNLRLQALPGLATGINAQWTWVLHVRD